VSHLKWTIGDVTITRLVELELPVPYSEKRPMIAQARPDALAGDVEGDHERSAWGSLLSGRRATAWATE